VTGLCGSGECPDTPVEDGDKRRHQTNSNQSITAPISQVSSSETTSGENRMNTGHLHSVRCHRLPMTTCAHPHPSILITAASAAVIHRVSEKRHPFYLYDIFLSDVIRFCQSQSQKHTTKNLKHVDTSHCILFYTFVLYLVTGNDFYGTFAR